MKYLAVLVLTLVLSGCDGAESSFQLDQSARFCAGKLNIKSFSTNADGSYKVQCENGDSAEVIVKRGTK